MEEFKKFAESTSMKGVPRFMKAKTLPIRILWLVSVLTLLGFSMFVCTKLIMQYLEGTRMIKIKDLNGFGDDYYNYMDMFTLPDITICNQNPLTAYSGYNGISWQEYIVKISPSLKGANQTMRGRYLSPRGYLEYIGPQAVVNNQHWHDFVIDCNYGNMLDNSRYPCDEDTFKFTPLPSVLYSQCYTVSVKHTYDFPAVLLSLTLYLDEVNAPLEDHVAETRATRGAVVFVHGRGHMPVFEDSKFASAGKLTSFSVKKSLYQRINDNNDPCWEDSAYTNKIQSLSGSQLNYSQSGCTKALLQNAVVDVCHCISSELCVLPLNYSLQELHFCGANIESSELESEIMCQTKRIYATFDDVTKECIVLCKETQHSLTVTSSPWPSETAQLSFYENFIRHKSYAKHFAAYENIFTEFLLTSDAHKALALLDKLSLIEKNFAKIEIVMPATRVDAYIASYQISLESLAASLGGNLNLWSGISVIIIIEVLDLIIRLLLSLGQHQTSTKVESFSKE